MCNGETTGAIALLRTFCWAIWGRAYRFESRADNRRVHNLFVSLVAALAHKDSAKVIGISCRDARSVWVGFRACFFETGALSAFFGLFLSHWGVLRVTSGYFG